jgi:hypothetical protein
MWTFKKNGRTLETKVTVEEAERFKNWDNSHGKSLKVMSMLDLHHSVVSRLPKTTSVLTCHGLADTVSNSEFTKKCKWSDNPSFF